MNADIAALNKINSQLQAVNATLRQNACPSEFLVPDGVTNTILLPERPRMQDYAGAPKR